MEYKEIISELKSKSNPKNVAGMARFGINSKNTLGVPVPELRKLAKKIKQEPCLPAGRHKLADELFHSGIHEARILAGYIAEPGLMTENEIDAWVGKFDSWDVCDQVCSSLIDKTKFARKKIFNFAKRPEEFVKRTAFTLMACLAVHDKTAKNSQFLDFFPIMKKAAGDERNFVKKAVNWALRQIGKRNKALNKEAIKAARQIQKMNFKSAKWIANNALKELESPAVHKRLSQ